MTLVEAVCSHTGKVDRGAEHIDYLLAAVPGLENCRLPGADEITHPLSNCGTGRFKVRCPNPKCGHMHIKMNWCYSRECPTCYPKWAWKDGVRASKRLSFIFQHEPKRWSGNPRNMWHADLTIPPERMELPYPENLKWAMDMMKKLGCRGGCYVGHPWRFRDKNNEPVAWKHSSMNRYAESPIIESYGILAEHIHVAGWGWLIPSDEAYERFGVVYTKLEVLPDEKAMARCLAYMLSHAGVYSGSQTLRWFGRASYNRVQVASVTKEEIQAPCPICGTGMEKEDPETGDWEPYYILITKRHYKFKSTQMMFLNDTLRLSAGRPRKDECRGSQAPLGQLIEQAKHSRMTDIELSRQKFTRDSQ